MTTWRRFAQRWHAWRHAIAFVMTFATSTRVRCELVLEVQLDGVDDDVAVDMIRAGCPGWHVQWCGDDRLRLVPPGTGGRS